MHRLVARVLKCVDVFRVPCNLLFIGFERSYESLFVGVVIAFADYSRVIDNSL